MKLTIRSRNLRLTNALELFVRGRVRQAVGRLRQRVSGVAVTLRTITRGRAGGRRACVVRVEFEDRAPIVIRRRHADLYAAVALAAARAGLVARVAHEGGRRSILNVGAARA